MTGDFATESRGTKAAQSTTLGRLIRLTSLLPYTYPLLVNSASGLRVGATVSYGLPVDTFRGIERVQGKTCSNSLKKPWILLSSCLPVFYVRQWLLAWALNEFKARPAAAVFISHVFFFFSSCLPVFYVRRWLVDLGIERVQGKTCSGSL